MTQKAIISYWLIVWWPVGLLNIVHLPNCCLLRGVFAEEQR